MLKFIKDEAGGGTIMCLFWFIILVAFCGLAVDTTNAFRNQTMLQASADASALAGAIDLPDETEASQSAINYAFKNMSHNMYGEILKPEDVTIGIWNATTRNFIPGGSIIDDETEFDAIHVNLNQYDSNENAVQTTFLRIAGFQSFDIGVEAIAIKFIPSCLRNGLIARQEVHMSTQNNFVNKICIHGLHGVKMERHNTFEPGVNVSMKDLDTLQVPAGKMDGNQGLEESLRENGLNPHMVDHTNELIESFLDPTSDNIPDYITEPTVVTETDKYDFADVVPGTIYHIDCANNKTVGIPGNTELHDVVIIADCNINVGPNVKMENVVMGSTAIGNGNDSTQKNTINFANDVELGRKDDCEKGGGVQLFSNSSIHMSSSMLINGLQIVAAGNIDLGASAGGINGIAAQAGGNITMQSRNMFGLCSGGIDGLFTIYSYRLVK